MTCNRSLSSVPVQARRSAQLGYLLWAVVLGGTALAACTGEVSGVARGKASGPSATPVVSQPGATASGPPSPSVPTAVGPAVLDTGRTTLRRLNIVEYDNTVRDLLGTALTPAHAFPADGVSDGFDTIGATLGVSPVLAQQLVSAASTLADELFARPATDPVRVAILPCTPTPGNEASCAQRVLSAFLPRAFRRPVQPAEVASFVALAQPPSAGAAATAGVDGLKAALEAVLLSPHFLFFVEPDTMPGSAAPVPLTDYELATRLSYLLWSTMPDDALFAAAAAGQVAGNPTGVVTQVTRMLSDPKAGAFAENFAGQWLQVHFLDGVTPSAALFPSYDDALRTSAISETVLFFQDLVVEDLPLQALLTANFSVLNARLGKQYGVVVGGQGFVKTSLAGTQRIGLLTQDSVLMGHSHPDRTSPVERGYFVLSQLMCTPPLPPPPGVPPLAAPANADGGLTVRQQLDAHATNPQCSGCHTQMDPIGYGLENFNAIGDYRTTDLGQPVNATGVLPGGTAFDGATQLAKALAADPKFVPCVTQQLLTYGVGRSFDAADARSYVTALGSQLAAPGTGTWRRLISTVATSDAFTTRRGEARP